MDRISIAKLQKNTVTIHPDIISLFDIYVNHIRPSMGSHDIEMEQNRVFFRPTLFIKEKTVWSMVNNFELYYSLKLFSIDQKLVRKDVSIGSISEEQLVSGIPFYELVDIIARYKKLLDIKLIYTCLNEILTISMNQALFNKNTFPITTFCQLININEQTYHKRSSESVL
ncbi:hypothetical protein [Psychrobacter sp. Ps6]|uniref:hypothetical protein n=1 Tax=Psychrobacter sp. Ps6 TaxID=2790960 RepID=UPI001EE0E18A|nr:hypothetical protein [Psychrobacter sp. Ps6]MCG3878456.1 hypothetical protein [Psychrobacter sp. Ps6]